METARNGTASKAVRILARGGARPGRAIALARALARQGAGRPGGDPHGRLAHRVRRLQHHLVRGGRPARLVRQPLEEHARRGHLRQTAPGGHQRAHRRAGGGHLVRLRLARLRQGALAEQLVRGRCHDGRPLYGPRPHPDGRHLRVRRQLRPVRVLGGIPRVGALERDRLRDRRLRDQPRRHGPQDSGPRGRGARQLRALHALHRLLHPGHPLVHLPHHREGGEGRLRVVGRRRPRLHAGRRGLRHLPHGLRRPGRPQPRHHLLDRRERRGRVGQPRGPRATPSTPRR